MSLDVYFRDDIANILRAVNQAGEGMAVEMPTKDDGEVRELAAFRRGFRAALGAVATAFGLIEESKDERV